jgi:TIR domain
LAAQTPAANNVVMMVDAPGFYGCWHTAHPERGERYVARKSAERARPLPSRLRPPVFFLSYARTKSATVPPNDVVRTTFKALTTNVANLVDSPTGEAPGFMDTEIEAGTPWRQHLLEMVSTSKVFVALLNAPYVMTSKWCAMEWDLFMRRTATRKLDGRPRRNPPVIPVIWAPVNPGLPIEIADVERFVPTELPAELQARYRRNGILGLHNTDREAYGAVVWELSLEISRLYYKYDVEPAELPDISDLRQAFSETMKATEDS